MSASQKPALPGEIESRRADIARICEALGVRRLELFGSGTRTASPRDLDFLADLGERPPAEYAAAYLALREALEKLFSKPVDLVTPPALANHRPTSCCGRRWSASSGSSAKRSSASQRTPPTSRRAYPITQNHRLQERPRSWLCRSR